MSIQQFRWAYLLILALLVACSAKEDASQKMVSNEPVNNLFTASERMPSNGRKPKTLYVEFESISRVSTPRMPEQLMKTPPGMSIAYLFRGDTTLVRINVPAAVLPDGRDRIILAEPDSGRLKIMFGDTLQEDNSIDQEAVRKVIEEIRLTDQKSGETVYESSPPPNAISWPALITIGSQEIAVEQFSRVIDSGSSQKNITYSIDKKIGRAIQLNSISENADLKQESVTNIEYMSISGFDGMTWPKNVNISTTSYVKNLGIKTSSKQNVKFFNEKVNTLPESYFTRGGL